MQDDEQADYVVQSSLIQALLQRMRGQTARRSARLVETHISWVLLAGRYAYKIKKSVDLGFLNCSSLEARHHYCNEEIRLNRRLAPKIYLDVVAIGGNRESPVFGGQPAIEYAVRMRRFAASRQLDRLAENNKILPQHIDSLAATIAQFHGSLAAAEANSLFGTPAAIHQAAGQNFEQLQALLKKRSDIELLDILKLSYESEFAACRGLFEQRLEQGHVRECHGDLHLGNIVLIDDQPVPFDGIDFNPALRWIDVINEIAFTMMDLLYHRRADMAWRFLNAWLEATGDYAGMALLRFYLAYRAMVRAKVAAIRASQGDLLPTEAAKAWSNCRGYLELAEDCYTRKRASLVITHGLPGSGKSTFAQMALEQLQAVRLRSDVERKRLFGLGPLAGSRASTGIDLYSPEITRRTYAHLRELARGLLLAGYGVIVDAAFLNCDERALFQQLAQELSLPFVIADMHVSKKILRERILQRQRAANDASEADIAVLEKLQLAQQPLSPGEQNCTVNFVNEEAGIAADEAGWNRLRQLLSRA